MTNSITFTVEVTEQGAKGGSVQGGSELKPGQLKQIYKDYDVKSVGTVLCYHKNPTCFIITIAGNAYEICF